MPFSNEGVRAQRLRMNLAERLLITLYYGLLNLSGAEAYTIRLIHKSAAASFSNAHTAESLFLLAEICLRINISAYY
jgi:hypothetical protein